MKRAVSVLLVILALLLTPFIGGGVVRLQVLFAYYACGECSISYAYIITKVESGGPRLRGRDIVLRYQGKYFADEVPQVSDFDRELTVTCRLHRRSIYDVVFAEPIWGEAEPFWAEVQDYKFGKTFR